MKEIYQCRQCGVVTEASERVCQPERLQDLEDYCGTTREHDRMCNAMQEHVAFVCGTCGRPAEQAELVCNPLKTG